MFSVDFGAKLHRGKKPKRFSPVFKKICLTERHLGIDLVLLTRHSSVTSMASKVLKINK